MLLLPIVLMSFIVAGWIADGLSTVTSRARG
jgi:hypothetical protein